MTRMNRVRKEENRVRNEELRRRVRKEELRRRVRKEELRRRVGVGGKMSDRVRWKVLMGLGRVERMSEN